MTTPKIMFEELRTPKADLRLRQAAQKQAYSPETTAVAYSPIVGGCYTKPQHLMLFTWTDTPGKDHEVNTYKQKPPQDTFEKAVANLAAQSEAYLAKQRTLNQIHQATGGQAHQDIAGVGRHLFKTGKQREQMENNFKLNRFV